MSNFQDDKINDLSCNDHIYYDNDHDATNDDDDDDDGGADDSDTVLPYRRCMSRPITFTTIITHHHLPLGGGGNQLTGLSPITSTQMRTLVYFLPVWGRRGGNGGGKGLIG